jgi:hypothetical protein
MAAEAPRDKEPASGPEQGPEDAKKPDPEQGAQAEKAGPKNAGAAASQGATGEQGVWNIVQQTMNFHGTDARGSVFGSGLPGTAEAEPRMYGRLAEAEIAKVAQAYAEPHCYGEAMATLKAERVVILVGPNGTGRRASAITMLDHVRAVGKPIVGLAPGTAVAQLATRTFDSGVGYFIADMLDADMPLATAEYHWDNACRAVHEAEAYLVVTTAAGARITRSSAARTVNWQRPDVREVLRVHAGPAAVDSVIEDVALALGTGAVLGKVMEAGRRISSATPEQVADLLTQLADNDHQHVRDWLDKVNAAIPEVLEVAALAFTAGLPERVIDEELHEFKGRVRELAPEISQSKEAKEEIDLRFRQVRKMRGEHPLLTVVDIPVARVASVSVRHLDFARPTYRSHVVVELWQRLDRDFWAGLRTWVHEIAAEGQVDLMTSAATGLALLAQRAPDEVLDCYLDPWTAEDASRNEEFMAVLVISQMSAAGDLATLALQIAMHWATQGSRRQRRVATYVFSGGLGARFPVDAIRRLSHLAEQGESLAGDGQAVLFMTLAGQGADGALVLAELRRRMNSHRDRPAMDRVVDNIIYLLSIRDPRSGRPAIAVFLMVNPGQVSAVAPLWARVLVLRPWRVRASVALLATIAAIERSQRGQDGERNPEPLVRSLGAAIGKALPPDERAKLGPELISANEKSKRHPRRQRPDGEPPDDDGLDGQASTSDPDGGRDDSPGSTGAARTEVSPDLLEIFLTACANPDHGELG